MPVFPIIFVLLVVHILLFHSEVVLLLYQGGLVAVEVTDFLLRRVGLLVGVDSRWGVLRGVMHRSYRAVQVGGQSAVLDLRLACNRIIVLIVVTSYVVVWNQTILLFLLSSCLVGSTTVHLSTLSAILLLLLLGLVLIF